MRLAQLYDLLQRISLNSVGSLTAGGTDLDVEAQKQFQDWAARFGYSFPDPQKRAQALNNWVSNMRLLYRTVVNGSVQYWAGENQFFHLSAQQYQDQSLMRNVSQPLAPPARLASPPGQRWHVLSERRQLSQEPQLPEQVDWLAAGKVTAGDSREEPVHSGVRLQQRWVRLLLGIHGHGSKRVRLFDRPHPYCPRHALS